MKTLKLKQAVLRTQALVTFEPQLKLVKLAAVRSSRTVL